MAATNPKGREFIICCTDGDVKVSKEQADRMFSVCEYFQNVFKHGTVESEEGVLAKPDWTVDVARDVVALLGDGEKRGLTLGSPDEHAIFQAFDQLQPNLCFDDGLGRQGAKYVAPGEAQLLLSALSTVESCGLTLACSMGKQEWHALVAKGVVFWHNDHSMIHLSSLISNGSMLWSDSLKNLYCRHVDFGITFPERSYNVFSNYGLEETLATIFQVYHCSTVNENHVSVAIWFKKTARVNDSDDGSISRTAYLASERSYVPEKELGGTFQEISTFLNRFRATDVLAVDLAVQNPDRNVLRLLMEASRWSQPLGVDVEKCALLLNGKEYGFIKNVLGQLLGDPEINIASERLSDVGNGNKRPRGAYYEGGPQLF